mmetsp:Transcript_17717/g.45582  ORF Transcript_17717/g.45582 Transcript_17717/m.45582 type:complete len:412 (+) Transcript_17717:21-1256(+)
MWVAALLRAAPPQAGARPRPALHIQAACLHVSVTRLGTGKGAIHPTGSNFRREARWDAVRRMRAMVDQGTYDEPRWLKWAERSPPLELGELVVNAKKVKNPYPKLIDFLLKKYPELRFHDMYVEGNDWSQGNDMYLDTHPAMQFVARQLQHMNQGKTKREAFKLTEEWFFERRSKQELEHKILMADMVGIERVQPMFTSPHGYWQAEIAKWQSTELVKPSGAVQRILKDLKKTAGVEEDRRQPQRFEAQFGNRVSVEESSPGTWEPAPMAAVQRDDTGEAERIAADESPAPSASADDAAPDEWVALAYPTSPEQKKKASSSAELGVSDEEIEKLTTAPPPRARIGQSARDKPRRGRKEDLGDMEAELDAFTPSRKQQLAQAARAHRGGLESNPSKEPPGSTRRKGPGPRNS